MRTKTLLLALSSLALACSTVSEKEEPEPTPASATEIVASAVKAASPDEDAEDEEQEETPKTRGVLIPADFEAVSLWPEAYSGELLVLEVLPNGKTVAVGDTLIQLDTETIDEQIEDAEMDVASTRIQHEGLLEKNAIAEEAAATNLARAEAALDRAKRSLEGFETTESEFQKRSDEMMAQREQARIDDQKDELAQLEAMYQADELTDETEEIVLKRSQRDLALTEATYALSKDRRVYRVGLADKLEAEAKREDVAKKEEELAHLVRTQAVDARGRADAEKRSAAGLAEKEERLAELKRDRELLTVKAPRSGVFLYGGIRDYRSSGAAKRIERGSKLSPRTDVLLVATGDDVAVAVDVPESMRGTLVDGSRIVASPVVDPEVKLRGVLALTPLPTGASGEESTFEGTITLEESAPELVFGMHVMVSPEVPRQ